MSKWIDAHSHLADPRFSNELDRVLEQASSRGISAHLQGGIDPEDWDRQLTIQKRYPTRIFPCFGLHPWFVSGRVRRVTPLEIEKALEKLPVYLEKSFGLGELGLDFGKKSDPATFELQKEIFEKQLAIARAADLPLVLHIVHAHPEAITILKKSAPHRGIVHAFSGSMEVSQEYLRMGLTISLGGAVLSPGYQTLKRAIPKLPVDRLVIESDCPALGCDQPTGIFEVARAIAEIRGNAGENQEFFLKQSAENLVRIFKL